MLNWIAGKVENIKIAIKDGRQNHIAIGLFPVVGDTLAADMLVELSDKLSRQAKCYSRMIRNSDDRKHILLQLENMKETIEATQKLLVDYDGLERRSGSDT